MKEAGDSGSEEAEKEENLGEKLARRRRVLIRKSRRGGPTTPVLCSWRLCPFGQEQPIIKDAPFFAITTTATANPTSPSARKLAAALWEFQHYFPLSKMHRGNGGGAPPPPRQRHHLHLHHHLSKDKGTLDLSNFLADNCPSSPDQVLFSPILLRFGYSWIFPLLGFCNVMFGSFSVCSLFVSVLFCFLLYMQDHVNQLYLC